VLAELAREGLIDDRRFAAMLVRRRAEQGYGRARVVAELRQLGVATDAMPGAEVDWDAVLQRLYRKRYGTREPVSDRDRTARWRYLTQRGFSTEQIRRVLRANGCRDAISDFSTS
jgi:regulatory protein